MDFSKPQYRTCQFCAFAEDRGRFPIDIYCHKYDDVFLVGDKQDCDMFEINEHYKKLQKK